MVELTCWTVIHTLGIWCLLYWHLTLQLLWSQSSKLKSLLWTLCLKTPQAVSLLFTSLSGTSSCHISIKKSHLSRPIRKSHPASLTACQEENDLCTQIQKTQGYIMMKNWSGTLGVQTGDHSKAFTLFLAPTEKFYICFNHSHKLNMSLWIHSNWPLRYKSICLKYPNLQMPPHKKFLWSSAADTFQKKKIFVLETDLLNKKARTLQINAKWVLMTFLFSFDEFYFPLCEASTEKVLFWEVENYRLPREVALSKAFLGNLV